MESNVYLNWKFDWDKLYMEGVDRITGHIIVKERNNYFQPEHIEIDLTKTKQTIMNKINGHHSEYSVSFEYSLTPHYAPIENVSYDALFAPSHMHDTILVIEGKKIHVSKAFLSYQSEYFEALFSKNFKEGSLSEIEIKEVSYDDFGLLCSIFYPNPQFPNDGTAEKLLIMARRFLFPSVTAIVEYHLIHNSKLKKKKMERLADKFGMPKLREKFIRQMSPLDNPRKFKIIRGDF
ncbi:unnamed protein product [Caenorhabditis nigoni]